MTSSKARHRSGIVWDGVLTVLARYCDRHGAQHVLKTRPKVGPSPRVILVGKRFIIIPDFGNLDIAAERSLLGVTCSEMSARVRGASVLNETSQKIENTRGVPGWHGLP